MTAPLAFTPGEPAGIGPDLAVRLPELAPDLPLVVLSDPGLLRRRAAQRGQPLVIRTWQGEPEPAGPHALWCLPVPLACQETPGVLDAANASHVLATLDSAIDGCLAGRFSGLVTGPVHKGVINDAGIPFSGHTEYLAERAGGAHPVMMLATEGLRVALATTHLPLAEVPAAITAERLRRTLRVLHGDLRHRFGIERPRILVCGLNPHAGEDGHLGREEIEVIEPVLDALRGEGMDLHGPLPADTLFTPPRLARADAVLAMYHDQGLPVLKHLGFGRAVNVTLGLPFVRTSVDHGTACELAGHGEIDSGSLVVALETAARLAGLQPTS